MQRDFLTPQDCAKLKKMAEVMSVQGRMRLVTNDSWLAMQMALAKCPEPPIVPGERYTVMLFGNKDDCYLCVRHNGHSAPEANGLAALRIDRKYLTQQFAPHGIPNAGRQKVIFKSMLAILNVPPDDIDVNKFVGGGIQLN